MNAVERYLKQATRGLWGQKRRDALMELRGAIEDKVYRHRMCGMSAAEAERAALQDLGNPSTIARELGVVHTGPQVARMSLLLGVAGLLGIQAAAQVMTVTSTYLPVENIAQCMLMTGAERSLLSTTKLKQYDSVVTSQGGPDGFQRKCLTGQYGSITMLKVADLLAGIRAAGGRVSEQAQVTPTTPLIVFGGSSGTLPQASFQTTKIGGERYLESGMVIPFITRATTVPLRLDGLTNPVLRVGAARVQLGTDTAPVQTTSLLSAALIDARRTDSSLPLPAVLTLMPRSPLLDPAAPALSVPGKEGDLYAVVQNILRVNQNGTEPETLWVQARTDGQIVFTDEVGIKPRIVTTLAALDAATTRREKAVLVYRLDASDLRKLTLTPVPAAQMKLIHQVQK